ncbi:MAG: M28 family peptidase, partial [Bacteroidales bacterium]|nr:M28 family peptidase [Bacteroidales bacterium]
NASGVSVVIETGRKLVEMKDILQRSVILVAFDGEEIGLTGSEAMVRDSLPDLSAIKVMFSLDMVGMYEAKGKLMLRGIRALEKGPELAKQVAGEEDLYIGGLSGKMVLQTDTWPFGEAGIPAVHLFTGLKSPYHQPEDESNLLDYNGMARITHFMVNLAEKLANEEILLPDRSFISKSIKTGFQWGVGAMAGYSRFTYSGEFYESKPKFSAGAGLATQIKLSPNFIIQPSLYYDYFRGGTATGDLMVHSLSPSVDLMVTSNNYRENFGFGFVFLGGYYRYVLAGFLDNKEISPGNDFYNEEPGLQAGFGLQAMQMQFTFIKKIGLSDVMNGMTDDKVFSRSTCFSVSWFF